MKARRAKNNVEEFHCFENSLNNEIH